MNLTQTQTLLVATVVIITLGAYSLHRAQQKIRDLKFMEILCQHGTGKPFIAQTLIEDSHSKPLSVYWFLFRKSQDNVISLQKRKGLYVLTLKGHKHFSNQIGDRAGYTTHPLVA